MKLSKVREDFPATKSIAFLDSATVSIVSTPAVRRVNEFLQEAQKYPRISPTKQYDLWEESIAETRREAAKLLCANIGEIALVGSTSDGLNTVAKIVPWKKSDNIVINNLEYLANVAPWWAIRKRLGVELRIVKQVNGRIRTEDIEAAIDDRTRVVAMSSVQWTNGYKADLSRIVKIAKEHCAYIVVDAIQQLGCLSLNANEGFDFLCCGGYKWLMCPMGVGIFYCREKILDNFEPSDWGETNTVCPGERGDWGQWFTSPAQTAIRDYQPLSSAARFDRPGTPNFSGLIGLGAELGYINRISIKNIEHRVLQLTDYLASELSKIPKAEIVSPLEEQHRSGILSFKLRGWPGSHHGLVEYLRRRRVAVSERYSDGVGGIRVSPHFFNNEEDIDRLVGCIKRRV